jgi:membrane protein DedA with SNARE-associated domain
MWLAPLMILAVGTLVSEDLTCVAAGISVRAGHLHWSAAIAGCFVGIYLGDLGLWAVGRLGGRPALEWRWIGRRLPRERLARYGEWFDRHAAGAILAARLVPGTRLPVYVAAGALGRKGGRFALWTFVAALVWTPALVLLAAGAGDSFAAPFRKYLGGGWLAVLAGGLGVMASVRVIMLCVTPIGRGRLIAAVSRVWRWEFWPMWLFYPPVAVGVAVLSLRYRGFSTITAANPGMPHGGFVGESKFDILSRLGVEHVSPTGLIAPGSAAGRVGEVLRRIREGGWSWPVILKPDVGQRGAGVELARCEEDVSRYLAANEDAVIVQPYHAGPFEAGVFHYRLPGEARGRIFSITDKQFPELVGDGRSTVEELIWRHPRYRMQAGTFLRRHGGESGRVPGAGERFRLTVAGNHCQGTLFRDGGHLWTAELERAVDGVARKFEGFYFGRFDVRYASLEAFRAGREFTVIELNGVTSESTNIYDPSWSLLRAYRTLLRQWAVLFRIGDLNRRRGHRPSTMRALARDVIAYYRGRRPVETDRHRAVAVSNPRDALLEAEEAADALRSNG